ncbi:MAG: hypothetical protein U0P30_15525 [Vicinamibacterales bacterium]
MAVGSTSMCTTGTVRGGTVQRSVVVDPARQPTRITRSACCTTARVDTTPPFRPTTPTASGCVSAIAPLPVTVVHTGALSSTATASSASTAPDVTTPPPQMNTGRAAERMASAAASTAAGSGPDRHAGYVACAGCAQISVASTGAFSTSYGRPMCAAPGRPVVM